ncbi:MAG: hypothetical protein RLZZ22_879, partial [Pseudomonadota bacterium]
PDRAGDLTVPEQPTPGFNPGLER